MKGKITSRRIQPPKKEKNYNNNNNKKPHQTKRKKNTSKVGRMSKEKPFNQIGSEANNVYINIEMDVERCNLASTKQGEDI